VSPVAGLEELFGSWERDRDLSGAVLMTRAGEVVLERCYGFADRAAGTPVTPATRFGLASVTKMFTAVAVVDLVASGALAFDTPVVSVLPASRRPSTLLPEVTVHHLLCHTSGIADYCEEDEESPAYLEDYGSLWEQRPSYSMERPADFLPLFGDLLPYRPPGVRFQYSNAGFVVLGLVVEELTGQPFTEAVQSRVFDRAGMTDSGFFRLDEAVPDVAVGYLPRESRDAPWRTNVYRIPVVGGADGGAFSTARDLDRFLRAYDDGTLLGDLRDVVLTPHTDAGDGFHQGYGVHLYPDGRYGHGGGDPGVEVLANRWPDTDENVVVLCNVEVGLAGEVRDAVVDALVLGGGIGG
jgi:CubicO group peptidase (beta-lactamase class C family)